MELLSEHACLGGVGVGVGATVTGGFYLQPGNFYDQWRPIQAFASDKKIGLNSS